MVPARLRARQQLDTPPLVVCQYAKFRDVRRIRTAAPLHLAQHLMSTA